MLFLRRKKSDRWETRQIFIEPKGTHLLETDAWKETFLESIGREGVANPRWKEYRDTILVGLPFFNRDERSRTFLAAAAKAAGVSEATSPAIELMAAEP